MQQCQYVTPDEVQCLDDAQDGKDVCVWHDADVQKVGAEWGPLLEQLVRDGQSLAGFELAHAQLDGINLTVPDHPAGPDLRGANLTRASLKGARLYRADFSGATLLKADLSGANLNAAHFEDADLLGASLIGANLEDTHWGAALRQDREAERALARGDTATALQNFREAEEIYRDLRMVAEAQGRHRRSGEFFYREMLMRHHRLPQRGRERLLSRIAHVLYGYGERPSHFVACALIYNLIFAGLFFVFGILDNGVVEKFDPAQGWAYNLEAFGDALYFSVSTFTTVGYGDVVAPDGLTRALAGFEALSGAFIMALFVVMFVRKLSR